MTEAFCGRRGRGRWAVTPVIAACALAGTLLAAPTAASACPSLTKVRSFHGIVSEASYEQSASGTDSLGGKLNVSLDHNAIVGYPSLPALPQRVYRHHVFMGKAKGGTISVADHYVKDDTPGPVTTGSQTASGPTSAGSSSISFMPSGKCNYQITFSFGIATMSSGQWPNPPDQGVAAGVLTPPLPTPANLKLSGSATVPVQDGQTSAELNKTGYYLPLGLGPSNQWGNGLDDLQDENGLSAGTATIGWSFSPTKKQHGHKGHK